MRKTGFASSARVDPADRLESAEGKRDPGGSSSRNHVRHQRFERIRSRGREPVAELRLARVDPHEGPSGGARSSFREHPHRRDVRSRAELEDDERTLSRRRARWRASRAARRSVRRPSPCLRTSGCSGGRGRGRKGRTGMAFGPGRSPRRSRPGFRPRSGSARRSRAGTEGSGSSRGTRRFGSRGNPAFWNCPSTFDVKTKAPCGFSAAQRSSVENPSCGTVRR